MSWLWKRRLLRSIERVEVLTLAPGDTLVLVVERDITQETAEQLKRLLEPKLKTPCVVLSEAHFTVIRGAVSLQEEA